METIAPTSATKPGGLQRWGRIVTATLKSFFGDPDNSSRCAATAFFGFLSFFPVIATVALIYGIVANRALVADTIDGVEYIIPPTAQNILGEQLNILAAQPQLTLGLGLLVSVPFALWSASRGIDSLLFAMSKVHGQHGKRGFIQSILYAVGLTMGGAVFVVIALLTVAGLPALIPIPSGEEMLLLILRWPVLLVLCAVVLAALYRWGPDRHPRAFRHIWPGAILASVLWVMAGVVFSIYVENWGNFDAVFGSASAPVVLLLWLFNSAQIFVLGAAFNAEIERAAIERNARLVSHPVG